MYVVEVIQAREGLAAPMAKMRSWLDHQCAALNLFEFALLPDRQIRFRLQFEHRREAAAFARAFGGQLISEPAPGAVAA
jgi:hypothetical protein